MGSSHSMNREQIRQFIDSENSSHQVVVWSKSSCPYCMQTKQLFKSMPSIDVAVHELDRLPSGSLIQQELQNLTGQRTVPNIFVQNQHMGGNDDIQRAHRTGQLSKLIKAN
jgi:glutaredoxin 3